MKRTFIVTAVVYSLVVLHFLLSMFTAHGTIGPRLYLKTPAYTNQIKEVCAENSPAPSNGMLWCYSCPLTSEHAPALPASRGFPFVISQSYGCPGLNQHIDSSAFTVARLLDWSYFVVVTAFAITVVARSKSPKFIPAGKTVKPTTR
jgi:hypothetical protein